MAIRMTLEELRRCMPDIDERLSWDRRETADAALIACGQPVAVEVERGPGRWSVRIANYTPASDNVRAKGVRAWLRAKRRDREVMRDWLVTYCGVPPAAGRRRLALAMVKRGPMIDPQNCLKSACDALVAVGLLRDDGPEFLELVAPTAVRGKVTSTRITLEDI